MGVKVNTVSFLKLGAISAEFQERPQTTAHTPHGPLCGIRPREACVTFGEQTFG